MSISANDPTGRQWLLYASDEVPTLSITDSPAPNLVRDTIYQSPIFLSTNKVLARQLVVLNPPIWSLLDRPVSAGMVEYVEFLTPAGVSWVVGLNDDGTLYVEQFTSGTPKSRRLVTTLMHKGTMLWVADNRMPPPRRGM